MPSFGKPIPQSGELMFVFFIYNEGVAAASGKPDLDVDYMFYRANEDKPFTKLATQPFNATTLPGQFDIKAGHQVFVGQGIPVKGAIPPGEYRMEIKSYRQDEQPGDHAQRPVHGHELGKSGAEGL